MKAIILVIVWTALYTGATAVAFHVAPRLRGARFMLVLFVLTVPAYVVTFLATPSDVYVLPERFVEPAVGLELTFGLWLYAAAFLGGVLQLYNIADRGFSLRILIDLAEAGVPSRTGDEVRRGYSAGRGIEWMLDKRLQNMLENAFIAQAGPRYVLTERGRRTARTYRQLKGFLQLGQGG